MQDRIVYQGITFDDVLLEPGYSDVLLTFAGADGVLGIHGTNEDWSVGHPVSHGCIRMHNSDITWLYRKIGLGAAVIVH